MPVSTFYFIEHCVGKKSAGRFHCYLPQFEDVPDQFRLCGVGFTAEEAVSKAKSQARAHLKEHPNWKPAYQDPDDYYKRVDPEQEAASIAVGKFLL